MHIAYTTPHGILMILSFIFAICAMIPWRPGTPAVPWQGLSWVFFVAAFIFGP
jgi:hypothetical protein